MDKVLAVRNEYREQQVFVGGDKEIRIANRHLIFLKKKEPFSIKGALLYLLREGILSVRPAEQMLHFV